MIDKSGQRIFPLFLCLFAEMPPGERQSRLRARGIARFVFGYDYGG